MMSDPALVTDDSAKPVPEGSEPLSLLPCAAALFDLDLRLVRANEAFLELCASPRPGAPLAALLVPAGVSLGAPAEGVEREILASSASGEPVAVRLKRGGARVGVGGVGRSHR